MLVESLPANDYSFEHVSHAPTVQISPDTNRASRRQPQESVVNQQVETVATKSGLPLQTTEIEY